MKQLLLLIVVLTFLSACKEESKTVEYWDSHPEELKKKYKECANNPAKARQDGNCINIAALLQRREDEAYDRRAEEEAKRIRETSKRMWDSINSPMPKKNER